ncbi:MAG: hypothetical protein ABI905_16145 [Betaproteobacteria bacterium]
MSKDLSIVEETIVPAEQFSSNSESIKLDDLSLALVGGGQCVVTF